MKSIKRKLITITLILLFTNVALSQQLANTFWSAYDTTSNVFNLYWHFDSSFVSYSSDNISYPHISIYIENGNSFKLKDIIPGGPCLLSDTGKYTFLIQNDTLRFTLISDNCFYRGQYFTKHYFVSLPTAIEAKNSAELIKIFPNPFSEELKTSLNNNDLSEIILYDFALRKIMQKQFTNSVSINTGQLAKGIYLYEVRNKNGVIKKGKVVKD